MPEERKLVSILFAEEVLSAIGVASHASLLGE